VYWTFYGGKTAAQPTEPTSLGHLRTLCRGAHSAGLSARVRRGHLSAGITRTHASAHHEPSHSGAAGSVSPVLPVHASYASLHARPGSTSPQVQDGGGGGAPYRAVGGSQQESPTHSPMRRRLSVGLRECTTIPCVSLVRLEWGLMRDDGLQSV